MVGRGFAIVVSLLALGGCGGSGPAHSPATASSGAPTSGTTLRPPAGQAGLDIVTQIGERCPHRPPTPDPRCDPVPRAATGYQVRDGAGAVVADGRSGPDGHAHVVLPAGSYVVRGEPVRGYQFTPERRVSVEAGATALVPLTYTTGIQ